MYFERLLKIRFDKDKLFKYKISNPLHYMFKYNYKIHESNIDILKLRYFLKRSAESVTNDHKTFHYFTQLFLV